MMKLFVAKRILLTLAYSEQFGFPLKTLELYQRLLVGFFVDFNDFVNSILFLNKRKLINYFEGYFFVGGLSAFQMQKIISSRRSRTLVSNKKWREVEQFVFFAKRVPFITGIAVTGSLAVNNAVIDDDIDFMLVTTANRLWLARLIIVLYASLKGKRRSFAKEEKNSWCFNLWVEETDLQLPLGSRSVYESFEVVQATWLLSKNKVASRFRVLNLWTKRFVFAQNYNFFEIEKDQKMLYSWPVVSEILFVCNLICFYFQYIYMKHHITREKVSRSHAFFHPRDTKKEVLKNWKQILLRLV